MAFCEKFHPGSTVQFFAEAMDAGVEGPAIASGRAAGEVGEAGSINDFAFVGIERAQDFGFDGRQRDADALPTEGAGANGGEVARVAPLEGEEVDEVATEGGRRSGWEEGIAAQAAGRVLIRGGDDVEQVGPGADGLLPMQAGRAADNHAGRGAAIQFVS